MTPEQQRIKIAEACGWRKGVEAKVGRTGIAWFRGPDDDLQDVIYHLPDYLSDLNAMHEAVKCKGIRAQGVFIFVANLIAVVKRDSIGSTQNLPIPITEATFNECEWTSCCIFAEANQWAEAFLRTLNLWDDSK